MRVNFSDGSYVQMLVGAGRIELSVWGKQGREWNMVLHVGAARMVRDALTKAIIHAELMAKDDEPQPVLKKTDAGLQSN